jgi:hypothetical protein
MSAARRIVLSFVLMSMLGHPRGARGDGSLPRPAAKGPAGVTLDLHVGTVTLPAGWSYAAATGVDSFVGHIYDASKRERLMWDQGHMAGQYCTTSKPDSGHLGSEQIGAVELDYCVRDDVLTMTVAPNVNLFGPARSQAERRVLLGIARSYHPKDGDGTK